MLIFIKYVNLIRINFENNENYILIVKHAQSKHFQSNINFFFCEIHPSNI